LNGQSGFLLSEDPGHRSIRQPPGSSDAPFWDSAMNLNSKPKRHLHAYTLIELVMVMAIMSLLVIIWAPKYANSMSFIVPE